MSSESKLAGEEAAPSLSSGVISVGASSDLVNRLKQNFKARQAPEDDVFRKQTYITSLIQDLTWAFVELGRPVNVKKVEEWAIFLHEMLTRESRKYHSVAHVYEISAAATPLQFLAAAFRDVVSHYIDGGRPHLKQKELLDGVFDPADSFVLNPKIDSDPRDLLVVTIFGFAPNSDLQAFQGLHNGLDVFLSAMLASRLLRDHLDLKLTAQLAACLEATIPFRKAQPKPDGSGMGPSPIDKLYQNLAKCNADFALGMSEQEVIETIQQAVDLRNRSVGNMVTDDLAEFLDHTWSLLPEQNVALRKSTLHTLTDYYCAVSSMVRLLLSIEPETVYGSFQGIPNESDTSRFRQMLTRNLKVALVYLRARLLSVAVVAAFAMITGGDAPKSFFFGDLPALHRESERLGDGLTLKIPPGDASDAAANQRYNVEVYDLLRGDRMAETGFDTRNAPFAAYIYEALGDKRVEKALDGHCCDCPGSEEVRECHPSCPFKDDNACWALLRSLPYDLVCDLGTEVGRIAISRKKSIERILSKLSEG